MESEIEGGEKIRLFAGSVRWKFKSAASNEVAEGAGRFILTNFRLGLLEAPRKVWQVPLCALSSVRMGSSFFGLGKHIFATLIDPEKRRLGTLYITSKEHLSVIMIALLSSLIRLKQMQRRPPDSPLALVHSRSTEIFLFVPNEASVGPDVIDIHDEDILTLSSMRASLLAKIRWSHLVKAT
mmetsp:Transcript_18005/g.31036  ORF Transcript_18005/g.31036 Transcript_18005/m.31036 type:complete len:182 (-) Transcript_18005:324-869(-)